MTQAVEAPNDQPAAFHQLLLRMAGQLPDELISEARRWLAGGELLEIAQAVLFAALTGQVAVTEADATLLADTLAAAGESTDGVADLDRSEADPQIPYGLAPVSPEVLAEHGGDVPYSIDLTGPYDGPGAAEEIDLAVVAAVEAQVADGAQVVGLWRTWRFPAMDTQWPPPRRIFLVHAADDTQLPRLAARLQETLEAVGETDPQVEVFADPDELPAYQRNALAFSTLLWAAAPATPVLVAQVFDTFSEESGPGFDPAHPQLDDDERDRVLSYLDEGVPLLITPELTEDVVDRSRGEAVPTVFRTDGQWIWTDAVSYYVREHRLAPDPDLLDDIRDNDYQPPEVDAVALHRALSALYAPVSDVDVWDADLDVDDDWGANLDVVGDGDAGDIAGAGADVAGSDADIAGWAEPAPPVENPSARPTPTGRVDVEVATSNLL
ncbi:hypothetical protein [Micromonospora sp. CB01531]|uniref:hypothetical protein n=1 Tax=Micromonospora sp. CB01531 TaxID=1718947 RepID=UPI000939203C|nr:hypothetical protein [Micromonospora sp. CB01531]OKI58189.1 hypothetical protein A6A27_30165 [Micromonospora sp. CB01531]